MRRSRDWGSIADRSGRGAIGPEGSASPEAAPAPQPGLPPSPVKPCWVTDRHGRLPGLLLEWRRGSGGFEGRVVRPVSDDEGWIVVEEWLPAGLLEPGSAEA